jgi:GNAT superfamily N-acetyltransferase
MKQATDLEVAVASRSALRLHRRMPRTAADHDSADLDDSADFDFSADPARLDLDRVHAWLADESYWAMGRSRAAHEAAVAASRNYGIYDRASGAQLAYARVITDGVTFAWLCDVFVDAEARGRGIGVALIERIMASLEPLGLRRIGLTTADAHGLYERFGFRPLDRPEQWMARVDPVVVA